NITARAAYGKRNGAEFIEFFDSAPRNISEAGYGNALAFYGIVLMFEHFAKIIYSAESRCFRADEGAAVRHAFSGNNAVFKSIRNSFILPEKKTNLSCTDADISGRNIYI